MKGLVEDIDAFRRRRDEETSEARQVAALFLTTGVDLADARRAPIAERNRLLLRLERMMERERLRGMRRHWSYDLNRHISLKQVLDHLRSLEQRPALP